MKTRSKYMILIITLMLLLSFGLLLADFTMGNLECTDIVGCGSDASCGGPGTVQGCNFTCEGGSYVICTII